MSCPGAGIGLGYVTSPQPIGGSILLPYLSISLSSYMPLYNDTLQALPRRLFENHALTQLAGRAFYLKGYWYSSYHWVPIPPQPLDFQVHGLHQRGHDHVSAIKHL